MKSIPIALRNDLAQDATSWTLLLKVVCKDGTVLGFTLLDADVTYDDGGGPLLYRADQGFMPERLQATADLGIDNTDLQGWYSLGGVTEAWIRAGGFDFADVWVYRVNFLALGHGHEIWSAGTLGESVFTRTGWKTEFRSLKQQLKQLIAQLYSLTCRAQFGSKPIGTPGAPFTERYPCNKDLVWAAGSTTAVGADPRLTFTDTSRSEANDFYVPGVIRWLTGGNAGAQMEVYSFTADTFGLMLPMPYPMQVGDTYEVRQDCTKEFSYCKTVHNNVLNFRGEHLTPVQDKDSLMVPGAEISTVGT